MFLYFEESSNEWEAHFIARGCEIFKISRIKKQGIVSAINTYRKIFISGNYDIVHSQIGFAGIIPIIACSMVKHCKAIAHSHYDNYPHSSFLKVIGRLLFNIFPCRRLACSYGAGYELFGKHSNFLFVKNGIDTEKYKYNEQVREEVRRVWKVDEKSFVVGTVAGYNIRKTMNFS